MNTFPNAITLDTLDELLEFHAKTFGGHVMIEMDQADDDGPDPEVDDDEKDDDADDEKDGDSDDDAEDYTPPTREEWQRTRDALKKANAEAKKHRLALREKGKADEDTDDEKDEKAAKVEAKWKGRVAKQAAKAALADAGAVKAERLLGLVKLDDLDVDDEGDVDGLDDEIDRLKEEYPELFTSKRTKGRVATGSRGDGTSKPKSATERQAAALRGGS